jgi:hypothetical protein
MDSLNTTTDSHEVTKFVEPEVLTESTSTFSAAPIPSSDTGTIEAFLGRPVLQLNTFWETTDALNTDIIPLGVGLPSDGLLLTNPMFVDKLKGYNLIRATINYRIQLNCNPFQQGRLLAHFLPFEDSMEDAYTAMHNYDMTTKTQQPSIELDCRESGAILSIPYLAPTTHFELHAGHCPSFERGRLHISVLSPLKTGVTGTADVEVAVWTYFTDVELRGPIVPQSSTGGRRSGRSRLAPEKEVMSETRIVSKGLSMASSIAKDFTAIPAIADFAGPAAWVLGVASGIASAFGYSKPDVDLVPTPMSNQYDKYMATSDGASPAIPLAALSTNSLSLENYSYGPDDEMSTAFLYGTPALVDTFEFTGSDLHNAVIYSRLISPTHLVTETPTTVGTNSQTITTAPPMGYLANKFKYWRGSIRLRLSLVRTEMQSGRIQVSFTPLSAASTTLPDVKTGSYAIRQIIDITGDIDTELVIPFMMPVHYLVVGQAMGTLEVRVVNQLRAPETAYDGVDVLVFASGGPDFELAVPCNPSGYNTQPIVPQGGDEDLDTGTPATLMHAGCCIGEMILSVRQIMRFTSLPRNVNYPTNPAYWPFAFAPATLGILAANPIEVPNHVADNTNYISAMYALYRGGMDVAFYDSEVLKTSRAALDLREREGSIMEYAQMRDIKGTVTLDNGFALEFAGTGVNLRASDDNLVIAAVPYYNRFPVALVNPTSTVVPGDGSQPSTRLMFLTADTDTSPAFLCRRPREDYQLTLFVGCPPYVRTPSVPA